MANKKHLKRGTKLVGRVVDLDNLPPYVVDLLPTNISTGAKALIVDGRLVMVDGKGSVYIPPLPLISAGSVHSLYTDYTQAWGWGYNNRGQLGDNTVTDRLTPVAVCGNHTFCHISGGDDHSLAIDSNGSAWGWGDNWSGQLGDNTTTSRLTPVRVCHL